jgi:hypothetical protein
MNDKLVFSLWLVTLGLIILRYMWGRPTAGLLLYYWMQLGLNHLFCHVLYSVSDSADVYLFRSMLGFEVTGYALLGLTLGIIIHDVLVRYKPSVRIPSKTPAPLGVPQLLAMNRLGTFAFTFGFICFVMGFTGVYRLLPSSTAVFSSSNQLFLAGLCLKWWSLRKLGRHVVAWMWASLLIFYPFVTTLVAGFIGLGMNGLILVGCFIAPKAKLRWIVVLLIPLALYFGMSVWVTYAASRQEVRERVWGGESIGSRVDVLYDSMVNKWQWVDIHDPVQLSALERMNQNTLIGDSVLYLESGQGQPGYGETLLEAVVALVPRIVWPSKPIYAGSGGLVTQYTGRQFTENTAVGIGQIMEFYVNFGRIAVWLGFIVLGVAVTFADRRAGMALDERNGKKFLFAFCVGHTLLNVTGCFSETLPSLIGVWLLISLVMLLQAPESGRRLGRPVGGS